MNVYRTDDGKVSVSVGEASFTLHPLYALSLAQTLIDIVREIMVLDEDPEAIYLLWGGNRCPYCKRESVSTTSGMETDENYATRSCRCTECERTWEEYYELAAIIEES